MGRESRRRSEELEGSRRRHWGSSLPRSLSRPGQVMHLVRGDCRSSAAAWPLSEVAFIPDEQLFILCGRVTSPERARGDCGLLSRVTQPRGDTPGRRTPVPGPFSAALGTILNQPPPGWPCRRGRVGAGAAARVRAGWRRARRPASGRGTGGNRVRFGLTSPVVTLTPRGHGAWEESAGAPELAAIARAADRLGFHHLTCSEHVAIPEGVVATRGGRYWDPLVTLGYLAAVTDKIRLATHVVVLPYHHPLEVVKRYGTLDRISQGRLILGVGVGSLEEEFTLLDVPFANRGPRYEDHLRALHAAWGRREPSYAGSHFRFSGLVIDPCATSEHPPLWIGGRSPRSLRRALEFADGWDPFHLAIDELRGLLTKAREWPLWRARRARRALCTDLLARQGFRCHVGRGSRGPARAGRALPGDWYRRALAALSRAELCAPDRATRNLRERDRAGLRRWRGLSSQPTLGLRTAASRNRGTSVRARVGCRIGHRRCRGSRGRVRRVLRSSHRRGGPAPAHVSTRDLSTRA